MYIYMYMCMKRELSDPNLLKCKVITFEGTSKCISYIRGSRRVRNSAFGRVKNFNTYVYIYIYMHAYCVWAWIKHHLLTRMFACFVVHVTCMKNICQHITLPSWLWGCGCCGNPSGRSVSESIISSSNDQMIKCMYTVALTRMSLSLWYCRSLKFRFVGHLWVESLSAGHSR